MVKYRRNRKHRSKGSEEVPRAFFVFYPFEVLRTEKSSAEGSLIALGTHTSSEAEWQNEHKNYLIKISVVKFHKNIYSPLTSGRNCYIIVLINSTLVNYILQQNATIILYNLEGYMEKLEQYLSSDYVKEKELQKSVADLIEKVIPTYQEGYQINKGFQYKLGEKQANFSASTTAMVASSMSILYGKSDLVVYKDDYEKVNYFINLGEATHTRNFKQAIELLITEFNENDKKNQYTYRSGTYGINDPFVTAQFPCRGTGGFFLPRVT